MVSKCVFISQMFDKGCHDAKKEDKLKQLFAYKAVSLSVTIASVYYTIRY